MSLKRYQSEVYRPGFQNKVCRTML